MRRTSALTAGTAAALAMLLAVPPAGALDNVATVAVGAQPNGMAYSPDGRFLYVARAGGLDVINAETNAVTTSVAIPGSLGGVAVTPDGDRAYVAATSTNSVVVVNTATNSVVATIAVPGSPYAVAATPDGASVLVTRRTAARVSAINTQTNALAGEVVVGNDPTDVAISADGSRAVVANYLSGTASVLSLPALSVAATVPVGANPYGVAMDPLGDTSAYVMGFGSNQVRVISPANTVTSVIPLPGGPTDAAVSRDGRTLYVAEYNAGKIAAVKLANATISGEFATGAQPLDVAAMADGSRVSASNFFGNSVSTYRAAPGVTTAAATVVKGRTATGNGTVRSDSNPVTAVRCYVDQDEAEVLRGPRGSSDSVLGQPSTLLPDSTQAVTCPFTDLTRGTEYYYLIAATDADGAGWSTVAKQFTTRPPKPAKPTVVRKKSSLKFSWTPTRTATSYQGRIKKKSGWKPWKTKSSPKVKFGNLKRQRSYVVQLRAGNESGYGLRRELTRSTR